MLLGLRGGCTTQHIFYYQVLPRSVRFTIIVSYPPPLFELVPIDKVDLSQVCLTLRTPVRVSGEGLAD